MTKNVLDIHDRLAFRRWLADNAATSRECWLEVRRGRPVDDGTFWYLDAVEESLCFGWIDSTTAMEDGRRLQRFSPRQKRSPWSELNKERVRRLERLGLMTDMGRAVLPDMGPYVLDSAVVAALKEADAWRTFCTFPPLYQRVRVYNVAFYRDRSPAQYARALAHLVQTAKAGQMFGEWNDYGRLLN